MRETWLDDTVGDEASPRRGFEDQLARELHQEWHKGRNGWRVAIWATAAAVLIAALVIVFANRDHGDQVVPADSSTATTPNTTVSPSTSVLPSTSTTPETSSTVVETTVVPPTDPGSLAVYSYLNALAEGRWLDAAKYLNEGGLEPEARGDMRPLFRPEFGLVPGHVDNDAVAAALQKWCAVSMCSVPESVSTPADPTVDLSRVATWLVRPPGDCSPTAADGCDVRRSATFWPFTFEGQDGVRGLPLQLPDASKVGATVVCPTDRIARQTWADLDGDGWLELVVATYPTDQGDNTISVCGSTLQVSPLQLVDGEGVWMYAANPTGTGPDYVLMGSVPPYPAGTIYQVDKDHWTTVAGPNGDATFAFIGPMGGQPGKSTGCATLSGESILVNNTYEYVGGTELSNSTQLTYSQENATGTNSQGNGGSFVLPDEIDAAFQLLAGYCNGLPVMTQT